ncbi:MAG: hypothetical protein U1F36_17185 [Planctomycetota bacterium]
MAIYELGRELIRHLERTSFGASGIGERSDLQRLLRDQIEIVAPDVLVISEEFGEWSESRRRIDLLGVDKDANIVVIELKRTEDGGHMELQALRYAAMVSTLTASRAVEVLARYRRDRSLEGDAKQILLDHLEWTEIDEDQFGQDVRLVLVAADFSRELTTAVLWLNERDLDIRCVRIRPYANSGSVLIDVQQIIPLPEAGEYQVQVREKRRREKQARQTGVDFTRYDITIDGVTNTAQWKRNGILLVVKALFGRGVSPDEIMATLAEAGRTTRVFCAVEGSITDPDEFVQRASEQATAAGGAFRSGRWHIKPADLMVSNGQTFVLSNQWGGRWVDCMQALAKRFPQVRLQFNAVAQE